MTKAQALGARAYVKKPYVSEKLKVAVKKELIGKHSVDFGKKEKLRNLFLVHFSW